ncbi:hypothetical protein A191_04753 [Escherichia coli KTE233]|jgi:hypothetical protein|nr:hypothetical protein A191_04753 [Escherichia coli KTE233]ELF04884.1 hypothetical protein A1Y7_04971 [Escherichia coli KTE119]EQV84471.1 hypothetical protein G893_04272 [Escherichia coli KOEGE 71 (186a)]CAD6177363.1 Uncharacterised protein [Escherichia coli]GCK58458.1 hypothetical protein BvCmsC16A_01085 [Escherichia coli]
MTDDPIMFWQAVIVLSALVISIIYNCVAKPKK